MLGAHVDRLAGVGLAGLDLVHPAVAPVGPGDVLSGPADDEHGVHGHARDGARGEDHRHAPQRRRAYQNTAEYLRARGLA